MHDSPLDSLDSSLEPTPNADPSQPRSLFGESPDGLPPPPKQPWPWRKTIVSILLFLIFVILLLVAIKLNRPPKSAHDASPPIVINTQSLDNGTLNKLAGSGKPQLTITPDTVVKNSLSAQGPVNASASLSVGGTSSLQGTTNIGGDLHVRGSAVIGGQLNTGSIATGSLSVTSLNSSGDLTFRGHVIPSGASVSAKPSTAASGGSVTVAGNDSAGTITITTGSNMAVTGEMTIISFHTAFSHTPKVQLTPINSPAAKLDFYATRSATFFTVNTASAPPNTTTYVFDYYVTQ